MINRIHGTAIEVDPPMTDWCLALHGNHDEHQCHLKPGHVEWPPDGVTGHECYCGVWW